MTSGSHHVDSDARTRRLAGCRGDRAGGERDRLELGDDGVDSGRIEGRGGSLADRG